MYLQAFCLLASVLPEIGGKCGLGPSLRFVGPGNIWLRFLGLGIGLHNFFQLLLFNHHENERRHHEEYIHRSMINNGVSESDFRVKIYQTYDDVSMDVIERNIVLVGYFQAAST